MTAEKSARVPLKLKWKIFSYLLVFCAVLLVVLWLFQTVFLEQFYRRVKVSEIKRNAQYITRLLVAEDSVFQSEVIQQLAEDGDYIIELCTENGRRLESFSGKTNLQHIDRLKYITLAKSHGGEYMEYPDSGAERPALPPNEPTVKKQPSAPPAFPKEPSRPFGFMNPVPVLYTLVYAKETTLSDNSQCYMIIRAVISPVNATVTTLRFQLYCITLLMLLFSVLLALLIARHISRPIEDISSRARSLAQGNYHIRFAGGSYLEIDELSQTLNTAARDLDNVESLRRELLANVSHDLRTPLSVIYSYAEIMHDFPQEITADQPQVIMDEAQRLTSLVNDMLDISKLETGIENLTRSTFSLTQLITRTAERTAALISRDGYVITVHAGEDVLVSADEIKITQVFYNLLVNAINYTGSDRTITVEQSVTCGMVTITVRDTGEGIEPSVLPHIWERYYRGAKNHKRPITGTGLGLSIVKKIVDLHGGTCGVQTESGKGSSFWFSLPRF